MKLKYPLIIGLAFIALVTLNNEIAKMKAFRFYNHAENIDDPIREVLKNDKLLCDEAEAETLVINLWATWCGPCQKEIPQLNQLVDKYEDENTLFLSVTDETEEKVSEWTDHQKHEPEYFQLYENKRLMNYLFTLNQDKNIKKGRYPELLPTNLIIHNGAIIFFKQGYSEKNIAKMDSLLNGIQNKITEQ